MDWKDFTIYMLVFFIILFFTYMCVYKKHCTRIMDELSFLAFWNKYDDEVDEEDEDEEDEDEDEDEEDEDEEDEEDEE